MSCDLFSIITVTFTVIIITGAHKFCTTKCSFGPLEVFCKKSVLRNFAKFTGKLLPESLFSKVEGNACNVVKKQTLPQDNFRTPS